MSLRGTGQGGTLRRTAEVFQVLGSVGFLSPAFLRSMGAATRKFGTSSAAGFHAAALRDPEGTALIDEAGSIEQDIDDVAGNDAQQHEDDDRDPEQGHEHQEKPPHDIGKHPGSLPDLSPVSYLSSQTSS